MDWKKLDKIDSGLYKGIAILLIVTHNFMHLFPAPQENEFAFYPDRFFVLLNLILDEPENIIRVSLSFFGHFGVQVFIFLSAYGLSKKYSCYNFSYWLFIWQRILKIYPAFILAIFTWLIITGWITSPHQLGFLGPLKVLYSEFKYVFLKLTLLSNFIPGRSLAPVGPWWFIPFIFQFYFVFPFLLYLYSRSGGRGLLAISIISIVFSFICKGDLGGVNIYFTIIGHLPEFCLGIYLARKDNVGVWVPLPVILSAFVIYFLGNIYETFWYANHISFLIILLTLFSYLTPKIKSKSQSRDTLLFFGTISMPLFLVNGFLREPFISWAIGYNNWVLTILLCLLSLIISVSVSLVLSKSEDYIKLKVNKFSRQD